MKPPNSPIVPLLIAGALAFPGMAGLPLSATAIAQEQQARPAATAPPETPSPIPPQKGTGQHETADDAQKPPGEKERTRTKILSAGAEVLQKFAPVNNIDVTVCGFHFYAGSPERQVIAHHFCSHLNDDVLQCVLYDTNKSNARLIGVEYIISEKIFKTLPEDEKKLWHSHRYEVKSGQLVALRIPDAVEKTLMKDLQTTYGKTWHFWQIDRGDTLPLGIPQLMMGFTQDRQADPKLVAERDREYGVDTEKKKKERADLPMTPILPGADAWEKGTATQLKEFQLPMPPFPRERANSQ